MLNFLGIGAQKAGTTWLYKHLSKHPEVVFPGGKEVHYWDWVQEGKRPDKINWYKNMFTGDDSAVRGDMTPAYAVLDERYLKEIYSLNPQLRILFIMRNPLERAWSAAQMELDNLHMMRSEASDQWFIDVFRSPGSLARGDYEQTLRQWERVFDGSQILLLFYEELIENPRALLLRTTKHIGVDTTFVERLPENVLKKKIHRGPGHRLTKPLAEELQRLYADKVASLSRYLNKDLSHWLEIPETL